MFDLLALTVQFDGTVSRSERMALGATIEEVSAARSVDAARLRAQFDAAMDRVEVALMPRHLRLDSATARTEGARVLIARAGAVVTDADARCEVFRTVVRLARGSSDAMDRADRLVAMCSDAFGLDASAL